MNNRKGFALLTVIFIVLVFSVIVVGLVALLFASSRSTVDNYRFDKAYYIADAGRTFGFKLAYPITNWTQSFGCQ